MTEIETFLKNYGKKLKNINEIVLNKKDALDFLDILSHLQIQLSQIPHFIHISIFETKKLYRGYIINILS